MRILFPRWRPDCLPPTVIMVWLVGHDVVYLHPSSAEAVATEWRGQGQAELHPETLIHTIKKNLSIKFLSCKQTCRVLCSRRTACPHRNLASEVVRIQYLLAMLWAVFRGAKPSVSDREPPVFCQCPGSNHRQVY